MSRYEDRTKEELLELARDRDISGRSGMTKDELISALRGEVLEEEVVVEEESTPTGPLEGVSAEDQEEYRAALWQGVNPDGEFKDLQPHQRAAIAAGWEADGRPRPAK
jgi:hypothetical protein